MKTKKVKFKTLKDNIVYNVIGLHFLEDRTLVEVPTENKGSQFFRIESGEIRGLENEIYV